MPAVGRHVLDADRHAVQKAERLAGHHRVLGAPRCGHRLIGGERDDRVDLRVAALDGVEMSLEHVERACGPGRDQPREFHRGAVM